ncbi:general substrate transporter [Aspergillus karnatakaensis]|uniref:sugar porter family MFS transporter n=1 Tax=Aspergillus karnatakaensis TaxID=1810916 RepID=UPI003CCE421A
MGFAFNSKDNTTPSQVYNLKLFWVIFVAAGGSVIFGYDLAFIGGVFSLPSFIERFELVDKDASAIQAHMVNTFQGGAFFGVMMFYYFNERFGRRIALVAAGCVFNIGVILQVSCHGNLPAFYVGRLISGMGIGGTSFVIPQYLSECAPAAARGGIIGCFEIGLQVGTIIGFWINYGVEKHVSPVGDRQWFIPITFQFIPATLMIFGLFFLSESPRWLYMRGRREEAQRSLVWLRQISADDPYVTGELSDYERQMEHELLITSSSGFRAVLSETFNMKIIPRLIHGCLLMIFQNSTGINAMNNFSVTFFQVIGYKGSSAKLFSTGIYGIVKGVVATITFLFLVDRFGRRPLLFVGSVMCAFSMYYLAAYSSITESFNTEQDQNAASNSAAAFIYIFGAGYAVGWNLPWIIAAEIFPTRVRSFCMVMTTCAHWLGEFYTSYAVTYMFKNITYGTFLFFASMTVLGAIYMYLFVPETNGVPLEDMDLLFGCEGLAPQQMKAYKAAKADEAIQSKTDTEEKGSTSVLSV